MVFPQGLLPNLPILHKPAAPSTGRGGMVQNAMISLRAFTGSSFFVRSNFAANGWLFAPKNELQLGETEEKNVYEQKRAYCLFGMHITGSSLSQL